MLVQEAGKIYDLVALTAALSTTCAGAVVDLGDGTVPFAAGSSHSALLSMAWSPIWP
jgi:hypothetical protein